EELKQAVRDFIRQRKIPQYLGDGRYVHATAAEGSDGVVVNSLRPGDPDFREDLFSSVTMVGSLF
ncbi:MAG: hypothetical protein ACLSX2_10735, partial [Christensenellaceae bacterium]